MEKKDLMNAELFMDFIDITDNFCAGGKSFDENYMSEEEKDAFYALETYVKFLERTRKDDWYDFMDNTTEEEVIFMLDTMGLSFNGVSYDEKDKAVITHKFIELLIYKGLEDEDETIMEYFGDLAGLFATYVGR